MTNMEPVLCSIGFTTRNPLVSYKHYKLPNRGPGAGVASLSIESSVAVVFFVFSGGERGGGLTRNKERLGKDPAPLRSAPTTRGGGEEKIF